MPTIENIKQNRRPFKKRDYRPYNVDGKELSSDFYTLSTVSNNVEQIIDVSPCIIKNWEFHDRPENELGNINELAQEFLTIGQQIPCIVRELKENKKFHYELIAGERRWRAAAKAKINLKVLVRNLSDNEAALVQISENSSRTELSDYAKGLSYARLIKNKIVTQSDLADKLRISKQQVSRFLSFTKIPEVIKIAIGDMSKISARTAEQIKQLSSKGEKCIEGIIKYAPQLSKGLIGNNKLVDLVSKHVHNTSTTSHSEKIYSSDGRHLCTLRSNAALFSSIHFPSNISLLLYNKEFDRNKVVEHLKNTLERMLMDAN